MGTRSEAVSEPGRDAGSGSGSKRAIRLQQLLALSVMALAVVLVYAGVQLPLWLAIVVLAGSVFYVLFGDALWRRLREASLPMYVEA